MKGRTFGLRSRLLAYLAIFWLIPVVLGLVAGAAVERARATRDAVNLLTTAVMSRQTLVRAWLEEAAADTTVVGQMPEVIEDLTTGYIPGLQTALSRHLEPSLASFSILDPVTGRVLASTHDDEEGKIRRLEPYLAAARQEPTLSTVTYELALDAPTLIAAAPIRNQQGEHLGIVAARLDLARLETIISEPTGLGQTGEVYLVNREGLFLTHTRYDQAGILRKAIFTPGVEQALAGQSGHAFYTGYRGVPVLGVYRPLPELDAALLAEMEQAEVFAGFRQFLAIAGILGALLLAAGLLGAFFVSQRVARPLTSLADQATRIAEGHLDVRTSVEGPRELAQLSESFNIMAEAVCRRTEALTTLNRIVQALNATLNVEEVFEVVAEQLADLIPHDRASIALPDETQTSFTVFTLVADRESAPARGVKIPLTDTAAAPDVLAGQPHITPDLALETEYPAERLLYESGYRSRVNVPLIAGGRVIGALNLASTRSNAFGPADLPLLEQVAADLAAALEKARLHAAQRRRAERMAQLQAISQRIAGSLEPDEVARRICQGVTQDLGYRMAWVGLLQEGDPVVHPVGQHGFEAGYLDTIEVRWDSNPLGGGPTGRAVRMGEPVIMAHINSDPSYAPWRQAALARGYRSSAAFPMRSRERIIGVLNVYAAQPDAFDEVEVSILSILANQAAVALENARLFAETRQRSNEMAALYQTALEIAGEFAGQGEMQPLLQRIVERATDLLGGDGGGLYLANPDGDSVTCVVSYHTPADYTGVTLRRGEGSAGKVLAAGKPLIIDDYRTWSGRAAMFETDQPFRAVISVPLKWAGRVCGVLHVLDQSGTRRFNRDDLRLLEMFAHHAATALENARQLEDARSRADELKALHKVALDVTSNLELPSVLEAIVHRAATLLGARGGGVYLYDPDREELELVVSHHLGRDLTGARLRLGEGLSGKVVAERRPMVVDDYRTWSGRAPQYTDAPWTAIIAVPLQVGERVLGVLNITDDTRGRSFGADDLHLATLFAAYAAIAVENAQLYADTRHQSQELARLLTQLEENYDVTLSALSAALDARDRETEGHSTRVAELACTIAQAMSLPEKDLVSLFRGGLLHDVGKIGISDAILHKPGPLDDEEWQIMRQHPGIGARILQRIGFLEHALEVVLYHHERYDGKGYPHGLQGEDIPVTARIFAVADAYDAMRSNRPYRAAMSHEEALAELRRCAGTQFDPKVVEVFLQVVTQWPGASIPPDCRRVPAPDYAQSVG